MSSRGRRRIDEIGDESRRRILDAAEELFAERGFDRTSFVDIAERSGISRGSIPWHFKNKHGLVMAVVERAIERAVDIEHYASLPTLAELFDDYAKWVRGGNSALLFMILTEAMSSTGAVHRQYQEFLTQRRRGVALWLRAQRPKGVDPKIASKRERTFAVALTGTLYGIHLQALIDPDGFDLDEALRLVAEQFDKNLADLWATLPAADDAPGGCDAGKTTD
ncbi:TetR/AcrR family acrAB operon transcriptional repressor [Thermocatellispora tengchongensis]|uniref:TetR/AcrR family acrAB operon transcriptional repressor n=1 Tax=Thermocatellispora tengchongensis TaxID=1073253 RepID=A0A840NW16_9ACTN|nr:TetR/AcrR family transcriptional regulator [Thermocatellispora tengchongensis]MBB5131402.1 TetR/AcrR family acrAB operon transcriptional repressor [Thermocatellispora tengchongensis]